MATGVYTFDGTTYTRLQGLDSIGGTVAGIIAPLGVIGADNTFYLKDDAAGYRSPQAVTVQVVTAHGALAPDADTTVGLDGVTYVANSVGANVGIVKSTGYTPVHIKQANGKAAGTQNTFIRCTYGGPSILLPAITSPSCSAIGQTTATLTAALSSTVTSAKYILRTTNTAPTTGEWSGSGASGDIVVRAAFTSPQSITGLTAGTTYYPFIWVSDVDGITAVTPIAASGGIGAITTNTSSGSPTFSSQPAASSITSSAFLVTWNVSNAVGYWRISFDGGTTWTTITPSGSGPYTYNVTGKATSVTYPVVVQNAQNSDFSGSSATSSSVNMTTTTLAAPTVTAGVGNTKITDIWAAVTNAVSYNIYYGTSSSAPTNPTNGSGGTAATAMGVTSPYDITGLTNGTPEHSWVQSVDTAGNKSAWSSDATATPYLSSLNYSTNGLIYDETWTGVSAARQNSHAYSLNDMVTANGVLAKCTTAGTSAGSAPTYATSGTTTDGTAVFTATWVNLDAGLSGYTGSGISIVAGNKGRAAAPTAATTAIEFACAMVPITTTAIGIQYQVPDVTNSAGIAWCYGDLTQPATQDGTKAIQKHYLITPQPRTGPTSYQSYIANPSYTQKGSSYGTPAANDIIAMAKLSTAHKVWVNGTEATNLEFTDSVFTTGSAGLRFEPAANGNYSDHSPIAFMIPNASGKLDVAVTGLPTGWKVSLTGAGQTEGQKYTESSGTATALYHTAGPSTGAVKFYGGGATLKVFDGSNTLILTKSAVYGGSTLAYS